MAGAPEKHLASAGRHERAAATHERLAAMWDERGLMARADLERPLAGQERTGAAIERDWAMLVAAERA